MPPRGAGRISRKAGRCSRADLEGRSAPSGHKRSARWRTGGIGRRRPSARGASAPPDDAPAAVRTGLFRREGAVRFRRPLAQQRQRRGIQIFRYMKAGRPLPTAERGAGRRAGDAVDEVRVESGERQPALHLAPGVGREGEARLGRRRCELRRRFGRPCARVGIGRLHGGFRRARRYGCQGGGKRARSCWRRRVSRLRPGLGAGIGPGTGPCIGTDCARIVLCHAARDALGCAVLRPCHALADGGCGVYGQGATLVCSDSLGSGRVTGTLRGSGWRDRGHGMADSGRVRAARCLRLRAGRHLLDDEQRRDQRGQGGAEPKMRRGAPRYEPAAPGGLRRPRARRRALCLRKRRAGRTLRGGPCVGRGRRAIHGRGLSPRPRLVQHPRRRVARHVPDLRHEDPGLGADPRAMRHQVLVDLEFDAAEQQEPLLDEQVDVAVGPASKPVLVHHRLHVLNP